MSSLSPLLNNLDAEDLAVRLFAILRLQDLTGSGVIPEKLRQAAEAETDPALKLYLSWLAYPEKASSDADMSSLQSLLHQKPPDWPRALRLLLQASKESAAPALSVLRESSLSSLPPGLLPILVGFYNRFGDSQDINLLESWCSHPNPAVTILAVEGLSRIQPDKLKNFLYPLLTSESAGIRSRAIRLLYRWHPQEAISQLSDMLASEIIDERRAALAHAFFLPFDLIKNDLIRFMIKEVEPALLVQAGQLLIINPDIEVAGAVAGLAVDTCAEKAPIIGSILTQQCEFLARINLINEDPKAFAGNLIDSARAASDAKRLAGLTEAIQAGLLQQQTAGDLTQAAAWLKNRFSLALPQQTLLEIVEGLAIIEPAFLTPHLPALLKMRDIKLQMAGLSAMARVSPAQAEKLLEQYLCSAIPARRRSGIKVLARLDKAFSQPLLLRALASETEKELLDLIENLLPGPLPHDALTQLLSDSRKSEASLDRQNLIGRLCDQAGLQTSEIKPTEAASSVFSNEEIMLGRAEKQIAAIQRSPAQHRREAREPAGRQTKAAADILAKYRDSRPTARIALIAGSIGKNEIDADDVTELLQQETSEMQLFALQAASKAVELRSQRSFSPVQNLKQNLAQTVPAWVEIAAVLAMMSAQTARLAAPKLQQQPWTTWPDNVIPFMLNFISISTKPQFSSQVSRFLRHNRPEIRCAAITCLFEINPGELAENMPILLTDSDPEVAATAEKCRRQIENQAGSGNGLRALLSGKTTQITGLVAIALLAVFYIFVADPLNEAGGRAVSPAGAAGASIAGTASKKPVHRFDHWRQPAEAGQERVVFGRIEENYSDSVLVHSPVLQMPLLIRHEQGMLPFRKNQHFNGRVRIDTVVGTRIESTLLPTREKK